MTATAIKPVHLKILVLLDRIGVLASRRIAEILDIARDTAEQKLKFLESRGLVKVQAEKLFREGREANMWELTKEGRSFVYAARSRGELPKVKLSKMNEELLSTCTEIMELLEKPLSFDEVYRTLETSGFKIRKYKLTDTLMLLEILGLIKKVPGHKEVKVLERIGVTTLSPEPGGVIVYMKTESADLDSAEF